MMTCTTVSRTSPDKMSRPVPGHCFQAAHCRGSGPASVVGPRIAGKRGPPRVRRSWRRTLVGTVLILMGMLTGWWIQPSSPSRSLVQAWSVVSYTPTCTTWMARSRSFFVPPPVVHQPSHGSRPRGSTTLGLSVAAISLEGTVSDDHEQVGEALALSLQKWLDEEWIPQEVHGRLAAAVRQSYVASRQAGQADLLTLMMTVADHLTEHWDQYDQDAFVNAYDIANYMSDYLTAQAGLPRCQCSSRIY